MSNMCKPCERDSARDNARKNAEVHRARARAYAIANPERVKEKMKAWRKKNRRRIVEYNERTSQSRREYGRGYAQKRRESPEGRSYARNWEQAHSAEKRARRKARLAGVRTEPVDRAAIILRDRQTCYLCGKQLKWRECTLDHVIPIAKGGSHTYANIRVACGPCNFSKQAKLIAQTAFSF